MTLPLKHFSPKEFKCSCGCGLGYESMKESVLTLVDNIRAKCGFPIIVTSSIRCPKHNKKIGGVKNSFHCQGLACDLTPLKKDNFELLCVVSEKLNPNGGVGIYPKNIFVHVDCRGQRARWLNG